MSSNRGPGGFYNVTPHLNHEFNISYCSLSWWCACLWQWNRWSTRGDSELHISCTYLHNKLDVWNHDSQPSNCFISTPDLKQPADFTWNPKRGYEYYAMDVSLSTNLYKTLLVLLLFLWNLNRYGSGRTVPIDRLERWVCGFIQQDVRFVSRPAQHILTRCWDKCPSLDAEVPVTTTVREVDKLDDKRGYVFNMIF